MNVSYIEAITNAETRLWCISPELKFLYRVGIFRVMHKKTGRDKVILNEWLANDGNKPFIASFPNDALLAVRYGICRDPSDFESGETIAEFNRCKVSRMWIPNMIANSPVYKDAIRMWAEIECDFLFYGVRA